MSRLSIELTSEEHQKIKAIDKCSTAALQELENLLSVCIEAAKAGDIISSSAQDIFTVALT
jgi:uncharacterized protein with PhoU and TrkA domain